MDLEPFTVVNQQSYRPSQRVSQGNPGIIYNQPPPNYRPQEVHPVQHQPPYLSYQQPKFYQGGQYNNYPQVQQGQQGQVYQRPMY